MVQGMDCGSGNCFARGLTLSLQYTISSNVEMVDGPGEVETSHAYFTLQCLREVLPGATLRVAESPHVTQCRYPHRGRVERQPRGLRSHVPHPLWGRSFAVCATGESALSTRHQHDIYGLC